MLTGETDLERVYCPQCGEADTPVDVYSREIDYHEHTCPYCECEYWYASRPAYISPANVEESKGVAAARERETSKCVEKKTGAQNPEP